jgi:hypothetical protein
MATNRKEIEITKKKMNVAKKNGKLVNYHFLKRKLESLEYINIKKPLCQ